MTSRLKYLANAVLDVFMPRLCPVCGVALMADERHLCRKCLAELPRTMMHTIEFNTMEQLFAGKVPIEHATGYFWYEKGSAYASVLHDIKYHNCPDMGAFLALKAGKELAQCGFYGDVDAVVPVPLHRHKLAQRGYNQSLFIARGLAKALDAPVLEAVKAVREHSTQTRKSAEERMRNTEGMYAPSDKVMSRLPDDAHLLIVDDVVTTGATLMACAQTLLHDYPNVKISLFTLSVARLAN
ncbi:MAG: ComF family protein [Muribaculaceae bacterium]|nr:ComF family protein [Muribaculaceae bacterium]